MTPEKTIPRVEFVMLTWAARERCRRQQNRQVQDYQIEHEDGHRDIGPIAAAVEKQHPLCGNHAQP